MIINKDSFNSDIVNSCDYSLVYSECISDDKNHLAFQSLYIQNELCLLVPVINIGIFNNKTFTFEIILN